MTATSESFIRIPDDSGNSGKKIRTQYMTVDSNVVHVHHFIQCSQAVIKGVYSVCSASTRILSGSAQNGHSSGAVFWLQVPTTSTSIIRIRKWDIPFVSAAGGSIVAPLRMIAQKFNHTGGWSGATLPISRRKTSDPIPRADVRTAMTGTTITLQPNGMCYSNFSSCSIPLGVNVFTLNYQVFNLPTNEDEFISVFPGEGFTLYHADAGGSSDPRAYLVNMTWDEIDNT